MYKYEYEAVTYDIGGWGLVSGNVYSIDESYRAIIENRAKDGWRYVGFIPTKQCGTGHTEEIDLVFEKEI
jgi:hypothetical protein